MPRKPPRSAEERLARTQKSMTPGTLGGRVASASPMALDATLLDPRLRTQKRPLGTPGGITAATTYLFDMPPAHTLAANTPTLLVFNRVSLIDEATATEGSPNAAPYSDALINFDGTNAEINISQTGLWYWALWLTQGTSTNTTDAFKVYGNSPANTVGTRMWLSKDPFGAGATSTIWGCDWVNSWFGGTSFTVWFDLTWTGTSSIGINPYLYLARIT